MKNTTMQPLRRKWTGPIDKRKHSIRYILRKTIEGYLDSVPSVSFNTIKKLN